MGASNHQKLAEDIMKHGSKPLTACAWCQDKKKECLVLEGKSEKCGVCVGRGKKCEWPGTSGTSGGKASEAKTIEAKPSEASEGDSDSDILEIEEPKLKKRKLDVGDLKAKFESKRMEKVEAKGVVEMGKRVEELEAEMGKLKDEMENMKELLDTILERM
jgi:hypothetical protein